MKSSPSQASAFGRLLKDWRRRRHLSQLDLALDAEISARHLSFVETGRARPSRDLVLHLSAQLEVPLRERNALLLAAGFAPVYRETDLDDEEMAPVRSALDRLLSSHEPFPAIAVNGRWDLVAANAAATALLGGLVAPELLTPPANALRLTLHPSGLARHIRNFEEWSEHLLSRLHRQAVASGDPALQELERELSSYPSVKADTRPSESPPNLYVPLALSHPDSGDLEFFSTISTFGTALDITISELAIESFFPANETTAAALQTHH